MNKKSKEIVKKLCFTLVIVISIITIIGCPNTVSNKTDNSDNSGENHQETSNSEWKPEDVIEEIRIKGIKDPIITKAEGLSFGSTPKGLCLYGGITFKDAKSEILASTGTWSDYPKDDYFYPNIKEGLEKRWSAAQHTLCDSASHRWLFLCDERTDELNNYILNTLNISGDKLKVKKTCKFYNLPEYFIVRGNMDVFVCTAVAGHSYFVDWHIVFVKKGEETNPEMYSFHFGPYIIFGKDNNNPKPFINVNYNEKVHMFTLSGMFEDYLKRNKTLTKDQISQVKNKFSHLNDNTKYDVYLVIGKFYQGNGASGAFFGYDNVICSFRNVLKLSDSAYWKDCWEKDESVKTKSP